MLFTGNMETRKQTRGVIHVYGNINLLSNSPKQMENFNENIMVMTSKMTKQMAFSDCILVEGKCT